MTGRDFLVAISFSFAPRLKIQIDGDETFCSVKASSRCAIRPVVKLVVYGTVINLVTVSRAGHVDAVVVAVNASRSLGQATAAPITLIRYRFRVTRHGFSSCFSLLHFGVSDHV
jgi:hypothetical protein